MSPSDKVKALSDLSDRELHNAITNLKQEAETWADEKKREALLSQMKAEQQRRAP
jgi:hypothetical protein